MVHPFEISPPRAACHLRRVRRRGLAPLRLVEGMLQLDVRVAWIARESSTLVVQTRGGRGMIMNPRLGGAITKRLGLEPTRRVGHAVATGGACGGHEWGMRWQRVGHAVATSGACVLYQGPSEGPCSQSGRNQAAIRPQSGRNDTKGLLKVRVRQGK